MRDRKGRVLPAAALMLCTMLMPGAGAVTSSQTVTLGVTFTAPPCTVDYAGGTSGAYDLGALPLGSKTYSPFTVNVTCSYARPSSLYATVLTGSAGGTTVSMVNDAGGGAAVTMTLSTGSPLTAIQYGTDGATNSAKQFCSGTTTRTCTLTPSTVVSAGTNGGSKSAAIVFTMVNP